MSLPKLLRVSDIAKIIGWSVQRTRRWLRRRGLLAPSAKGTRWAKGQTEPHLIPRDALLALEESTSLLDPGDL